jgi:hypothetical protein
MVKSMQPSAGPSKVFNRAEIDERKCQQQMKVFDGLDASTPGMMRQLCIADQNLRSECGQCVKFRTLDRQHRSLDVGGGYQLAG